MAPGTTSKARRDALIALGYEVDTGRRWEIFQGVGRIAFHAARRLGIGPLVRAENRVLLASANRDYDVIWIEKGIFLCADTIRVLRKRTRTLIHFTPDHAFNAKTKTRHFLNSLPLYDICGTTKPEEPEIYFRHGAQRVMLLQKSYNPEIHRPYAAEELIPYRSDISFIGVWTAEKERVLKKVIQAFQGCEIRIWGPEWQRKVCDPTFKPYLSGPTAGVFGHDYGRVLAATKVNLGLLANDATQFEVITDRIMEIPACGSLLIAPRTQAIQAIFQDGEEALLFSSDEDMIAKISWALCHETEREEMAHRGRAKVLAGPYRDQDVVELLLKEALAVQREP